MPSLRLFAAMFILFCPGRAVALQPVEVGGLAVFVKSGPL